MQQATEFYSFEVCHSFLIREDGCCARDYPVSSTLTSNQLAAGVDCFLYSNRIQLHVSLLGFWASVSKRRN